MPTTPPAPDDTRTAILADIRAATGLHGGTLGGRTTADLERIRSVIADIIVDGARPGRHDPGRWSVGQRVVLSGATEAMGSVDTIITEVGPHAVRAEGLLFDARTGACTDPGLRAQIATRDDHDESLRRGQVLDWVASHGDGELHPGFTATPAGLGLLLDHLVHTRKRALRELRDRMDAAGTGGTQAHPPAVLDLDRVPGPDVFAALDRLDDIELVAVVRAARSVPGPVTLDVVREFLRSGQRPDCPPLLPKGPDGSGVGRASLIMEDHGRFYRRRADGTVAIKRSVRTAWEPYPAAIPVTAEPVTAARATELGRASGRCLACNRPIRDSTTGYGPTCRSRFV